MKLTLKERIEVAKYVKQIVESRKPKNKKRLNEGFKRDALNAIDEAEETFTSLKELSEEALDKLETYIRQKVHIYDEENLEFAIEIFLNSDEWDEDELLQEMDELGEKIQMRHGTEKKMVIDCILDVANAINQFVRKKKGSNV